MVVAVRTPPYNSWKDPAERVMSVLNCGAQCVGLMRAETQIETKLTNCSSLKSIRKLADDHPDLEVGIIYYMQHLFFILMFFVIAAPRSLLLFFYAKCR